MWYQKTQVLLMLLLPIFVLAATGSVPDYASLIATLRGEDTRLFRWDATEHTRAKQTELCGKESMFQTLSFIVAQNAPSKKKYDDDLLANALEYVALCVTDNPSNRAVFASFPEIHDAIIGLIGKSLTKENKKGSALPKALSKLSHVIYITAFANPNSHQAYIKKGAVVMLGSAIKANARWENVSETQGLQVDSPIVTMWSAAALANLAASYCSSEKDGRCYWNWNATGLEVTTEFGTVTSDGSLARETMLKDDELVQMLVYFCCLGHATDENEDIMVGENALIDRDEDLLSIVPWAAASALKNLALDMNSHSKYLEPSLSCFCHLSKSVDWLEAEKALHLLERARRGYPCYFGREVSPEGEVLGDALCIDHAFFHDEGYTCADFDPDDPPSEEECDAVDRNGIVASSACCACGGGTIIQNRDTQDDFDEEL